MNANAPNHICGTKFYDLLCPLILEEDSDVSEEPASGKSVYIHIQSVPFIKIKTYVFYKAVVNLIFL